MKLTVVPATPEDAAEFAPLLRAADQRELLNSVKDLSVEDILRHSLEQRGWAEKAYVGDVPLCIGGLSYTPRPQIGCPWLVGTNAIYTNRRAFLRLTCRTVARMSRDKPILANYVAAENTDSIEWLTWLGFEVRRDEQVRLIPGGTPFHLFTKS